MEKLPKAIIIDFHFCRVIDLDAMVTIEDMVHTARQKKVKVVILNVSTVLSNQLKKFGFRNDRSSADCDLDKFLGLAANIPMLEETDSLRIVDIRIANSAGTSTVNTLIHSYIHTFIHSYTHTHMQSA